MTTWAEWARRASASEPNVSSSVRLLGTVIRIAFVGLLLVITVRVSMPQNETIWTAYDTPGDLVRLVLGFAACVWIGFQFFVAPKDAHSHRTWLYIGAVALPLAVLCLIAIW